MRGVRSTIILLAVLLATGGYAYYISKKPAEDTTSKQEKVFGNIQADKIDEIRVKSASGDTTTLRKESGVWQVVEPIKARADESEVSGMTSALAQLSVVRVIDENPGNLKDYGLATPRIEVAFKTDADKTLAHTLLVGEKSPTGADLFAERQGQKRVFLIPAYQESSFNRSTFELRDKTVLKFERDKVDGIEVSAGSKSLQFTKEGGDWKLKKPLDVRADFGSVEGLVGRLQTVQMKSIVSNEPSPADLKKYGLDKPTASVNLNLGSARATLVVGGKADDTTVYARDTSKPLVMTIESSLADELKKTADDYRRKDLFEFRPYNANRIEITRNGTTVAFEKVKGEGQNAVDKWRRVSPSAADADKDKVDSLVSRLSNMRASSFVESTAKTGLDAPAMTVVVKFDDGKKEDRVTFGKHENDVYAARPGEPGAAKIDATDFTEANKTLDELAK
jgi:Domain of unknown function (DUF4340)